MNRNVLLNTDSRVFIKEKAGCCDASYTFHACMRFGELSKDYGDVTSEYCPDENKYGEFVEVAVIGGVDARATTNLAGRLSKKYRSVLESFGSKKCPIELQLHFGSCSNPSNFNEYELGLVLEDVIITNYSTDALSALSPDEAGSIIETVELSIGKYYYISPLSIFNLASTLDQDFVYLDIAVCDLPSCFGCDDCIGAIYVLFYDTTPGTIYIASSMDDGVTWNIITTPYVIEDFVCTDAICEELALNSNIMCFDNDVYLSFMVGTAGQVVHLDAQDVLTNATPTFTVVYDGSNDLDNAGTTMFASKLVLFKNNFYAIQVNILAPGDMYVRQINLDGSDTALTVFTQNYLPSIDSLVQYNNEILMVGYNNYTEPEYAYTNDGTTWIKRTIPLYTTLGLNVGYDNNNFTFPYPIDENNWQIFIDAYDLDGEQLCVTVPLACPDFVDIPDYVLLNPPGLCEIRTPGFDTGCNPSDLRFNGPINGFSFTTTGNPGLDSWCTDNWTSDQFTPIANLAAFFGIPVFTTLTGTFSGVQDGVTITMTVSGVGVRQTFGRFVISANTTVTFTFSEPITNLEFVAECVEGESVDVTFQADQQCSVTFEGNCRCLSFCTSDAGLTYSYNGIFQNACDVRVCYNPTKNVLYAIGLFNNVGQVWRSINAGKTWTLLPDSDNSGFAYDIATLNLYDYTAQTGLNHIRQVYGLKNDPNLLYGISQNAILKFN